MSTDTLTVITGATGKTGRRVAALMREQGKTVREVSRSSKTTFDWHKRDTWANALEGAGAIFVVAPYGVDPEALRAFADQAVVAGATRAVLLSTPAQSEGVDPAVTEAQLSDAGLDLTALRLRWFNQNFSEDFLLPFVLDGELRLPAGQGREAFIDAEDIAEVAVAALTTEDHRGRVYELTGPRLLSFEDVASELSAATGRQITYVPLARGDFVAEQVEAGSPAEWAHLSAELYTDIASGALEVLSTDVETVLGRPARDFTDYARHTASTGVWNG
jgi:uncharacterized protein YbjT (DUF2867 family)